jgi:hypothetical protein
VKTDRWSKRREKNNGGRDEICRKTGYTWADFETNTEIAKEINTTPILDKTQEYRRKLFATYT